jgi:3-deoxy-D-manno-octulosonic-acid transferase
MNGALRLAYTAAGQLARALTAVAPARSDKLARSFSARRGLTARYEAWSPKRDPSRPLLWMHAPSVGEGLQARVILERLRAEHPEVQLAYTFFSPSAESFARGLAVDFAEYLPFDTQGDVRVALGALRPTALVYSKLDVWPVLSDEARQRGVGLGMTSATVSAVSSRRGTLARHLLRDAYAALDRVGAISEEDARRLESLGVRPAAITVTGDTRYDQVLGRARRVDRGSPLLAALSAPRPGPTLVAGSTWPADEAVLLPAWVATRRECVDARLVIAPHEPEVAHIAELEAWAAAHGFSHARLGAARGDTDVVIVDRVGVLGDLYALADAAFVGGGFHTAGLHSVLEPAAYGVPVAFGPRHENSRDAGLLMRAGGGDSVASLDELTERLTHWLTDPSRRETLGGRARAFVEAGAGAVDRSVALVLELLAARGASPGA